MNAKTNEKAKDPYKSPAIDLKQDDSRTNAATWKLVRRFALGITGVSFVFFAIKILFAVVDFQVMFQRGFWSTLKDLSVSPIPLFLLLVSVVLCVIGTLFVFLAVVSDTKVSDTGKSE